jgi:hypothetical protein
MASDNRPLPATHSPLQRAPSRALTDAFRPPGHQKRDRTWSLPSNADRAGTDPPRPGSEGQPIHTHPATLEDRPGLHGPIGFYDHDSFLVESAVEFLLPALREGSVAVAALTGDHQVAVERALALAGIDLEAARSRGDYVPVDSEQLAETWVVGGEVEVERFDTVTRELFRAAAGRPGEIRICGDLATVLWDAGEVAAVLTLEHLWSHLPGAPAFEMLCLYSTSVMKNAPADAFSAACALHTKIEPIESYQPLIASNSDRAGVLLDAQQQSHRRDHETLSQRGLELQSELDQLVRKADEQQQQFSEAIASRDVIGQAKGILMARLRIDDDTAFAMLRDTSSRSHRKLHTVAQTVVDHQLRRN